jgi:hypothetical protein
LPYRGDLDDAAHEIRVLLHDDGSGIPLTVSSFNEGEDRRKSLYLYFGFEGTLGLQKW